MFKIGDIVKLKSYDGYGDYVDHDDQTAIICENFSADGEDEFHYQILWTDKKISNVMESNIKLHIKEWDDVSNK